MGCCLFFSLTVQTLQCVRSLTDLCSVQVCAFWWVCSRGEFLHFQPWENATWMNIAAFFVLLFINMLTFNDCLLYQQCQWLYAETSLCLYLDCILSGNTCDVGSCQSILHPLVVTWKHNITHNKKSYKPFIIFKNLF